MRRTSGAAAPAPLESTGRGWPVRACLGTRTSTRWRPTAVGLALTSPDGPRNSTSATRASLRPASRTFDPTVAFWRPAQRSRHRMSVALGARVAAAAPPPAAAASAIRPAIAPAPPRRARSFRARRLAGGSGAASTPAVPLPEVLGDRPQVMPALVPARRRPFLDVQVAGGGVAGLAHDSDSLPGTHDLALAEMRPSLQVRIHPVMPGPLAVDHEVVAGAAGLVGPPLHPPPADRHQRGAAGRKDVLALVDVARARGADTIAVGVPAADRELETVVLEPGVAG